MNENTYTIDDIQKRTNLSIHFIRRCIQTFSEDFKPYTTRGNNNTLLFDSNGLVIFDQIMQEKQKGSSLPVIQERVFTKVTKPDKQDSETLLISSETDITKVLLNELKEYRIEISKLSNEVAKVYKTVSDKESLLSEKEKTISIQSEQLKLLTDGRPPEQVKEEFISKEVELRSLKVRSEQLENDISKERSKLEEKDLSLQQKEKELLEQKKRLSRLEDEKRQLQKAKEEDLQRLDREKNQKLQEQEKILREKEEKAKALEKEKQELEEKAKEKEKKKQEIIKELEALEGKWFVGTKRKELLKQLQDLG